MPTTDHDDWLTIKIPRVRRERWPGRPVSPILSARASSTLKSLVVALQEAGVKSSKGYRAGMDHNDAIEWLLDQVADAGEKGD